MLFAIKKTYCEGSTSGNYGETEATDNTGYWNVPVDYHYNFVNSLDRGELTFLAATGAGSHSNSEGYTIEDVTQQHFWNRANHSSCPGMQKQSFPFCFHMHFVPVRGN